ncbi:MAG: DMT family transporter [Eubacteriales bacterium]
MIGILIALLSGILMSVQGVLNTQVTKMTSVWVTNIWVQMTALFMCLCIWGIADRTHIMTLTKVEPRYLLLGGVIGTFITLTVIKSMGSLGPAKAVMLIVVAQIVSSYCIELFGLFGMERVGITMNKVIGLVLAIVGIIIFEWNS